MALSTIGYFYLTLAIVSEVTSTTSMKLSEGWTVQSWSIACAVFGVLLVVFQTLALEHIPMSTLYVTWSGVGTAAICVLDWQFFGTK